MHSEHPDHQDLAKELETLRAQGRRLRIGVVLLAIACAGAVAWQAAKPPSGEFSNLVIKDEQGRARIELGVSDRGPGIYLYDPHGKKRIQLAILEYEPPLMTTAILEFPGTGEDPPYAALKSNETRVGHYSSGLFMRGMNDCTISLGFPPPYGAELELQSMGERKGRLCLHVNEGFPTLLMADDKLKYRARLWLDDKGSPTMEFRDRKGKALWTAP
jgi:hypothetical protein